MKRNILLAFLLVGLVVMEWGCKDEPIDCGSSNMRIIGLTEVRFYETTDGETIFVPLNNTQSYNTLEIWVLTETERIVSCQNCSNSTAFAMTAPMCTWQPDSISITRNGEEITSSFTIDGREINEVLATWPDAYGWCEAVFQPKLEAANNSTSVYTFTFFDNEGETFQISSKPFKITK